MDWRFPLHLKIDKRNIPKYSIFILLKYDISKFSHSYVVYIYVYIAYDNCESNPFPLLLKTFLIMDSFIDVVTDVGPGAVVKGVISGTLRMAIPAMLADKVGCGYI